MPKNIPELKSEKRKLKEKLNKKRKTIANLTHNLATESNSHRQIVARLNNTQTENQQLTATNQATQTENQRLTATNQATQTENQQLTATLQEIQTQYQQLITNHQEIQIFNQQLKSRLEQKPSLGLGLGIITVGIGLFYNGISKEDYRIQLLSFLIIGFGIHIMGNKMELLLGKAFEALHEIIIKFIEALDGILPKGLFSYAVVKNNKAEGHIRNNKGTDTITSTSRIEVHDNVKAAKGAATSKVLVKDNIGAGKDAFKSDVHDNGNPRPFSVCRIM